MLASEPTKPECGLGALPSSHMCELVTVYNVFCHISLHKEVENLVFVSITVSLKTFETAWKTSTFACAFTSWFDRRFASVRLLLSVHLIVQQVHLPDEFWPVT